MNLMNHHVTSWKLVGLWHWNGQPRFYPYYTVVVSLLFCILFPLAMAMELIFADDISEIINIIMFLPTALGGLKAFLIIRKRPVILEMFDLLQELDEQQLRTEPYRNLVRLGIEHSRRFIRVLIVVYFTSGISDYISPLLKTERVLMWTAWYPFDTTARLAVYHSVLLYQFVATLYTATIIQSTDVFGGSIYCVVGAHLDVLGERIKGLGTKRTDLFNFSTQRMKRAEPNQLRLEAETELKDCVRTHKLCVRCV